MIIKFLNKFPHEILIYIYEFLYNFDYEKEILINELKSHIIQIRRLYNSNNNNFLSHGIKPSLIIGRYVRSYSN
jgi:hypothetical protein